MIYYILTVIIVSASLLFIGTKIVLSAINTISFKESLESVGLPIITIKQNNFDMHFVVDTGSTFSLINEQVCKYIKFSPISKKATIIGIDGVPKIVSSIKIRLNLNGNICEEVFQVTDMSASMKDIEEKLCIPIHGILGNSFMQKYKFVLDFNKKALYYKKK